MRRAAIHLTFDDGPDPEWTPRILAALERAGARATFFVMGRAAAEHPEIVRMVLDAGHEVELHCMQHIAHWTGNRAELEADLDQALAVLDDLGVRPRRLRPPGGNIAEWTRPVAAARGLEITKWSVDPRDWDGAAADELLARALPVLRPGSVVLLHDGLGPGAVRAGCEPTELLIEPLVAAAQDRDLEPRSLGRRHHRAVEPYCRSRRVRDWARHAGRAVTRRVGRLQRRTQLWTRFRRYEMWIFAEEDIDEAMRRQLGELLAGNITREQGTYRERAWRKVAPVFRVVAMHDGDIVGQQSVFLIETDPQRRMYGMGDLVVHPGHRGAGVGLRLMTASRLLCRDDLEAELILGDTHVVRAIAERYGYRQVPRFGMYYESETACHWHHDWICWGYDERMERLRLLTGDF